MCIHLVIYRGEEFIIDTKNAFCSANLKSIYAVSHVNSLKEKSPYFYLRGHIVKKICAYIPPPSLSQTCFFYSICIFLKTFLAVHPGITEATATVT